MSGKSLQEKKANVKNFEPKVINRSLGEIFVLNPIANIILRCTNKRVPPYIFSLLSLAPLLTLSFMPLSRDTIWLIAVPFGIFMHQLMDVVNKKQAYRQHKICLSQYYLDHIIDCISCGLIVIIITRVLQFKLQNVWICVCFFGFLPFYLSHISTTATDFVKFQELSPQTQGLLVIQIFFLICAIYPAILDIQIKHAVSILNLFVIICIAWLLYYLFTVIKDILNGKSKLIGPKASIFTIILLSFAFFQGKIAGDNLLENRLLFMGLFAVNQAYFSILIGKIIVKFVVNNSYPRMGMNTLIVTFVTVAIFTFNYLRTIFKQIDVKMQLLIFVILAFAGLQLVYCIYYHRKVLTQLKQCETWQQGDDKSFDRFNTILEKFVFQKQTIHLLATLILNFIIIDSFLLMHADSLCAEFCIMVLFLLKVATSIQYPNCKNQLQFLEPKSNTFSYNFVSLTNFIINPSVADQQQVNNAIFAKYIDGNNEPIRNSFLGLNAILITIGCSLFLIIVGILIMWLFAFGKYMMKQKTSDGQFEVQKYDLKKQLARIYNAHKIIKRQFQALKEQRKQNQLLVTLLFIFCLGIISFGALMIVGFTFLQQNIDDIQCQIINLKQIISIGTGTSLDKYQTNNQTGNMGWQGIEGLHHKFGLFLPFLDDLANNTVFDNSSYQELVLAISNNLTEIQNQYTQLNNVYTNETILSSWRSDVGWDNMLQNIAGSNKLINKDLSNAFNSILSIMKVQNKFDYSLTQLNQGLVALKDFSTLGFNILQYHVIQLDDNFKILDNFATAYQNDARLSIYLLVSSSVLLIVCCSIIMMILIMLQWKFTKFLRWLYIGVLVVFIIGLVILYISFAFIPPIVLQTSSLCSIVNQVITDQNAYNQLIASKSVKSFNLLSTISTCLFDNGDYLAKLQIQQGLQPIQNYLIASQNFESINDISSPSKIDILNFVQTLEQISSEANSQIYATAQKFINPQSINLISELNRYTLSNEAGQNCYKDRWVIDWAQCSTYQTIINNIASYNPYRPSETIINCLTFNIYNTNNQPVRFRNETQILSLYSASRASCPNSYINIELNVFAVLQQLETHKYIINSLVQGLIPLKQQVQNTSVGIRTYGHYLQTKQSQLKILASSNSLDLQTINSGGNCSVIKQEIYLTQYIICSQFQASLRIVSLLSVGIILFGLGVISFGFLYQIALLKLPAIDFNYQQYTEHGLSEENESNNNVQTSFAQIVLSQNNINQNSASKTQDSDLIIIDAKNDKNKSTLIYLKN